MPELPEVETIKNDAREHLLGLRVTEVNLKDPTLVRRPAPEEFVARLTGRRFEAAERQAKNLILGLDSGDALVLQLVITGQFLLVARSARLSQSNRLVLDVDDGRQLRLVDSSLYAKALLLSAAELPAVLGLERLGPDPTTPVFTAEWLAEALAKRRGRIKPLLLDQHFLAGLGNIYVDEALFLAGIAPTREARSLSAAEVARLHGAIREVLLGSIAKRGTTFATYRDLLGRPGHYQEDLRVFHRTGQPCPRCGGPIQMEKIGGRDTHFCPRCQV
ncbi:MAG: bifunctional DNA-formamidopyrimidine glycosylase/DNA-(apurinic or apyrimidinic site) lyase [Chloroflexota bacterium]